MASSSLMAGQCHSVSVVARSQGLPQCHQALHVAAENGHAARVASLCQSGVAVDAPDAYGWRALHFAASNGHVACVRELLDAGASIDAREAVEWTPLHMAGMNGCTECASVLVQRGADASAVNKYGLTVMHVAARSRRLECCRVLHSLGAPVNGRSYHGETPLHLAAANGCGVEMVRVLVEVCGADHTLLDNDGRTVADAALARRREDVAGYLSSRR